MLFSALLTLLNSCNGYNNIMYKYLSNEDNYVSVSGVVEEIYFYEGDGIFSDWSGSADSVPESEYVMYISIHFMNEEDYLTFSGASSMAEEYDLTSVDWTFEIIMPNAEIMIQEGLLEDISIGNEITVTVSNWIYMDGNFFEIIELTYNENTYLEAEDGLSRFVEYMDEHKSLL